MKTAPRLKLWLPHPQGLYSAAAEHFRDLGYDVFFISEARESPRPIDRRTTEIFFTQTATRATFHANESARACQDLIQDLRKIGGLPAETTVIKAYDLISEAAAILTLDVLRMAGAEGKSSRTDRSPENAHDTQSSQPSPQFPYAPEREIPQREARSTSSD